MLTFLLTALETDDDRAYLTRIYLAHERTMYAAALRILNSPAAAEDAVQDSFIKVIRHWSRCREIPENKIGAWLVIIVRNTAIDLLRRAKKTAELDAPDTLPDEEDGIAAWNASADLAALLERLPLIYRTTLSLKFLEGWTDQEIAQLLGITERTVRSRIFQARKRLKHMMEERT